MAPQVCYVAFDRCKYSQRGHASHSFRCPSLSGDLLTQPHLPFKVLSLRRFRRLPTSSLSIPRSSAPVTHFFILPGPFLYSPFFRSLLLLPLLPPPRFSSLPSQSSFSSSPSSLFLHVDSAASYTSDSAYITDPLVSMLFSFFL